MFKHITPTEHPRIFKSHEPCMAPDELKKTVEALGAAMERDDVAGIHAVLRRAVEGYRPEATSTEPEAFTDSAEQAQAARTGT